MQNVLKRFMLIGAASLFLLPAIAHSQVKQGNETEKTMRRVVRFFDDEINAGRLTPKQAMDYVQCAQKEAREAYLKSPEGKEFEKYLKQYGLSLGMDRDGEALIEAYKKMSATEKTAFEAENRKAVKAQEPFQDQAEEHCMKKLGVRVPPGRAWGRY